MKQSQNIIELHTENISIVLVPGTLNFLFCMKMCLLVVDVSCGFIKLFQNNEFAISGYLLYAECVKYKIVCI